MYPYYEGIQRNKLRQQEWLDAFNIKSFETNWNINLVRPAGLEPTPQASETCTLSS